MRRKCSARCRSCSARCVGGHLEVVGEQPGPQRRAGVHVEGQRGRAAVLAERRRHQRVGPEVGAEAAVALRARTARAGRPRAGRRSSRTESSPRGRSGRRAARSVAPELLGQREQLRCSRGQLEAAAGDREAVFRPPSKVSFMETPGLQGGSCDAPAGTRPRRWPPSAADSRSARVARVLEAL